LRGPLQLFAKNGELWTLPFRSGASLPSFGSFGQEPREIAVVGAWLAGKLLRILSGFDHILMKNKCFLFDLILSCCEELSLMPVKSVFFPTSG
jgi:hypothetical protein